MRPVRVIRPARASYEIRNVASVGIAGATSLMLAFPTVPFDDPDLRRQVRDPLIFCGPVQTETAFRITLWPSTLMLRSKPLGTTSQSLTVCGTSPRLA